MKKLLLLSTLVFSMIGAGQVWLVQLSSYHLWAFVGPQEFHSYHIAWWHSIWGPIFVPAGLSILCTVGLLWFRPPAVARSSVWVAIGLIVLIYGLTYIWWAPLMALIGADPAGQQAVYQWAPFPGLPGFHGETQDQLYRLLMTTHWGRVGLLTLYALVIFWMAWVGLELTTSNPSSGSITYSASR
jgi:hypothetical protein